MPDKMLIDAAHPEETRVVVLRGNRVEEFDFESANRKQLRGNIYLAKVTRVEPSLQAAFVDYGGNRHGFLAFSEIHPDYYQIPVADRQALIAQEERDQRAADADADHRARAAAGAAVAATVNAAIANATTSGAASRWRMENWRARPPKSRPAKPPWANPRPPSSTTAAADMREPAQPTAEFDAEEPPPKTPRATAAEFRAGEDAIEPPPAPDGGEAVQEFASRSKPARTRRSAAEPAPDEARPKPGNGNGDREDHEDETVESVGGADALEEVQERAAALPPPVQDPGSDQAPAGNAGAGGQGRARQQGRGAHIVSLARRPLFGADAQHRARRRHLAQDHIRGRPQPAQRNRAPNWKCRRAWA